MQNGTGPNDSSSSNDLLGFVSSLGGGDGLRVEENLGEGFVRLRVSEAERRQAKHDIRCVEDAVIELLRNSRDAGARRIFVATGKEGTIRTTTVLDDGVGIPRDMWSRVFDARVTSKLETMKTDRWGVHGRGMALFSIAQNVESARVMDSEPGCGTSIRVVSDSNRLQERADQSTWPAVHVESGKIVLGAGPHNIVRTCCEFACEEESSLNVYVGSAAQIVAAIRTRIPDSDESLVGANGRRSVFGRLRETSGPRELAQVACDLGLDMSERTAQRVVSDDIEAPRDVWHTLQGSHRLTRSGKGSVQGLGGGRMSQNDLEELARNVQADAAPILERYYSNVVGTPVVRVRGSKITITLHTAMRDE